MRGLIGGVKGPSAVTVAMAQLLSRPAMNMQAARLMILLKSMEVPAPVGATSAVGANVDIRA